MKFTSIAFRINGGFLALIVLLLLLGGLSLFSVSSMTGSMIELNEGMSSVRGDLETAATQMGSLEESVDILKQSDAEFSKLRQMQGQLQDSRQATVDIGAGLGRIETSFEQQSSALNSVGNNVTIIGSGLRKVSGETQKLIRDVETINSLVLQTYIGFFNYLNEFVADVETPLAQIDEIKLKLGEVTGILGDAATEEQALVKGINKSLRRYRRYMSDLGETTSTTQITELKEPLITWGGKIMVDAQSLREKAWAIADRQSQEALIAAGAAEKEVEQAIAASVESGQVLNHSLILAREASSQIGELTTGLTKAITGVDKSLSAVPKAISGATESLGGVRKSMQVVNQAMTQADESVAASNRLKSIMLTVCIAAVLFGIGITVVVQRTLVRPLGRFTRGLHQAAHNDLTVDICARGTSGELKELIEGMNNLLRTFGGSVGGMNSLAQEVHGSAQELDSIASELTAMFETLRNHAKDIATATNALTATTHTIAKNSEKSKEQADTATQLVNKGDLVVNDLHALSSEIADSLDRAIDEMEKLADDSKKVDAVINIIKEIADQTNLLAINASIEAARAGNHGKGFAVVAEEVRNLAQKTAQSTDRVDSMIQALQQRIAPTMQEIQRCSEKSKAEHEKSAQVTSHLSEIDTAMNLLTEQTSEIAAGTNDQDKAFPGIAARIKDINEIAAVTGGQMQTVGNQAASLVALAGNLQEKIALFKVDQQHSGSDLRQIS